MAYEIAYVPNAPRVNNDDGPQPVSRTYQYRKVMKPMLERKRRARINRCLDELKELMVSALQAEGENVAKLEKADILELTVRHLHNLRRKRKLSTSPTANADRFRAGYTHAAAEVSKCLASTPGVDVALGTRLMTHLGHRLNDLDKTMPLSVDITPCSSPSLSTSSSSPASTSPATCYGLPLTPACSPEPPMSPRQPLDCSTAGLLRLATKEETVWRPW